MPATTQRRTVMPARDAAVLPVDDVLSTLGSSRRGLTAEEAAARLASEGPNDLRLRRTRALKVFARQWKSPLLILLLVAAAVASIAGEHGDTLIIGVIVAMSTGLGFVNEYRAGRASDAMQAHLTRSVVVRRGGELSTCDVTTIVPGDIVRIELGSIVPADVRLVDVDGLSCDESTLTGESEPAAKNHEAVTTAQPSVADLSSIGFMGTVVVSGSGDAVVVATGADTELGHIAERLGGDETETEFQRGLRRFSMMLARIALVLTSAVFVVNLLLGRPLVDAMLFSLAIAVGITPELLPAVVSTSLATGARKLAAKKVLVKRLVSIEDLANIEVLLTDKTGTLTEGSVAFRRAVAPDGTESDDVLRRGLACTLADIEDGRAIGGSPLDVALWNTERSRAFTDGLPERISDIPFGHERMRTTVLVREDEGSRAIISKGAPERILELCDGVDDTARRTLEAEFAQGSRVVAVARRDAPGAESLGEADESGMTLVGYLVFLDPPKESAADAVRRLGALGIRVGVITGDNATVAEHVCDTLGLRDGSTVTGADIDAMDDDELLQRMPGIRIYARMDPEQKMRVVSLHRTLGRDVAYMGDGVNDAVAIEAADVGISVDSATDVARNAADIVLLQKDLNVLADGVTEGRRIFANTIKYVLMGTSSNFGNMSSAAAASAFIPFLPMLPTQILLNNLLYDAGQMTIPTDRVDDDQLARPSHWDIGLIRRFMTVFGPVSSLIDFTTFFVMLRVLHAGEDLFRTGWFVESLATQSLVIFVMRTRRSPFWRSTPGRVMSVTTVAVVVAGIVLPMTPVAPALGFTRLPARYYAAIAAMVAVYLFFAETAKRVFYRGIA